MSLEIRDDRRTLATYPPHALFVGICEGAHSGRKWCIAKSLIFSDFQFAFGTGILLKPAFRLAFWLVK